MNDFYYDLAKQQMGVRFNPDAICIRCQRKAHEHCYSLAGHKEVSISHLCEECFDEITKEEDE